MSIIKLKKNDFMGLRIFRLLSQMVENSVNYCDFLKLTGSIRGGHCYQLPRAPKFLATPVPLHTIKVYEGMEVLLHQFLISALDRGKWSASYSGRIISKESPTSSQLTGG
jgi:hypothetical protein